MTIRGRPLVFCCVLALLVAGVGSPALAAGGAASASVPASVDDVRVDTRAVPQTDTAGGDPTPPCAGVMSTPANGITVVSVQGMRTGDEGGKTAARLVAFGPRGEVLWVHRSGRDLGVVWSYDVDPLGNGNVFVTATRPGKTLLYELNASTGEPEWTEVLPFTDTHDADPLNRTHVVVANMRNPEPEGRQGNGDRVVVYDRANDEIEWTWYFDDHYSRDVGGNYSEDWTHVNDVDAVDLDGDGDRGHFLLSPRNFDQVIAVNRTSGEIDAKLGSYGDRDVLHKQHNPDFLLSRGGTPTFLVADSENDRVVEYARTDGGWERTWSVGSDGTLAWPRDADRLRGGHTLVGDSRNDRVLEVTPRGEVVWEVYAPWLVYDAERVPASGLAHEGDGYRDLGGSRGPTATDLGAGGSYDLENASPPDEAALERCAAAIDGHEGGFRALPTANGSDAGDGNGTDGGAAHTTVEATTVPADGGATDVLAPGLGVGAAVAAVGLAAALAALAAGRRRR